MMDQQKVNETKDQLKHIIEESERQEQDAQNQRLQDDTPGMKKDLEALKVA